MFKRFLMAVAAVLFAFSVAPAWADSYQDALKVFKGAGQSGQFFFKIIFQFLLRDTGQIVHRFGNGNIFQII